MLTADEALIVAATLRSKHRAEMLVLDEVRDYMSGKRGLPTLPDDPDDDLRELRQLCVKNVMPLVVETFVESLTVVGMRSPDADSDDAAWEIWQRERMDARQVEVHRPAVTYGASYVLLTYGVTGVEINPRTPRRMFAAYADPTRDEWPQYALEVWVDTSAAKKVVRGVLWDEEAAYPLTFSSNARTATPIEDGDPEPHPFGVCPVVRFVNARDAEETVRGEVSPLIVEQKAINAVNFDRLIVSRFGAFPQKYLMGWAPETSDELTRMSAKRVWALEDADVKAGAFPAANVTAYNEILDEMVSGVAVKARVPIFALTGMLSNVGAETVALIDAPNQRKVRSKQLSFGESWEQALRLAAAVEGVDVADDTEILWADTDARSFAQVVDGIVKLTTAGVPVEAILDQVPGLTQQKVDTIVDAVRRNQATGLAAQVIAAARQPAAIEEPAPEPVEA